MTVTLYPTTLQDFLDLKREQHTPLSLEYLLGVYEFVEYVLALEAIEDQVVGDAGVPYHADLEDTNRRAR